MRRRAKLQIEGGVPEAMARIESVLAQVEAEDVPLPELANSGGLTRDDLGALRGRLAADIWSGKIKPGQLSLRRLHRECQWQTAEDRATDDVLVQVHLGMALIDVLDFLIAALRKQDRLEVGFQEQ